MTVNYTTNLSLGQPVTGTESGTWGDDVNNAVTSYLDIAIAGGLAITITTTDVTLSITQGTSSATNIGSTTAQYAILNVSGAMTAARNLIVPSSSRIYLINNNTTGGFALTVKGSATSGVTLVNGEKAHVFWNGTDYAKLSNASGGAGVFSSITNSGLTSGRVVYSTTGGLETDSANLTFNGTTLTANTIGAFTLSGTIAGGGNQINNVIIGTTNPLAGAFTTLSATGVATFSAGSAAAPAITTTGDTNTGIFFPAADTIAFAEGGAEAMRIDSSGNLGIGTTTPSVRLAVLASATGTNVVAATFANDGLTSGSTVRINFLTGEDGTAGRTRAIIEALAPAANDGALGFQTRLAGTVAEKMRLDSSGNLGIGVTSPLLKLQVGSSANDSVGSAITYGSSATGSSQRARLWFSNQAITNGYGLEMQGDNNALLFQYLSGGSTTERMRIDSSGNVGIGTTSPSEKLDVAGNAKFTLASSVGLVTLRNSSTTTTEIHIRPASGKNGLISFTEDTIADRWVFGIKAGDGSLFFNTGTPATNTDRMILSSAGNLGIGVAPNASFKLDIQNTSGVAAIRLKGGTGAAQGGGLFVYKAGSNATLAGIGDAAAFVGGAVDTSAMVYADSLSPILFYTGAATRMTLDISGNLGLGVTPSAWGSNFKAFELANSGAAVSSNGGNRIEVGTGSYINSAGNYVYTVTGTAVSKYVQTTGISQWFQAPSGTAGNTITFTQAMTLDTSGNLLVGTTTAYNSARVSVLAAGGSGGIVFSVQNNNDTYYPANFRNTSAISVGNIACTATTTTYNTSSDQRLKENIQDAAPASALIDAIQVRQFDWKSDGSHTRYGFVAQELVTVAPEAVHQPADTEEIMAVDYSKLVPMLVKEIQSLRKRLADAGIA